MKKFLVFLIAFLFLLTACKREENNFDFPKKPITMIVYTGPGGLIDITARKFVDIANKYSEATFVVENKPGSGGIVALKRLMQLPADGYTVFASTKSNISKIVSSGGEAYIDGIDWAAMMMADPECIITHTKQEVNSWEDIVADAKLKNGKQLWLGPANGGLDHVTAMKIWDEAGIKAKWIPFKSGGKARAALLGEQGVAYVGNPREILGNAELKIAAISRSERLAQFPNVPTFRELGFENLDNEIMWRGFVLKKGTPPEIKEWYDELFTKVNNDPDWREYWERGGVDVVYKNSEEFTKIVQNDKEQFSYYLSKIGIINVEAETVMAKLATGSPLKIFIGFLLVLMLLIGIIVSRSKKKEFLGRILIPIFFIFLSLIFFVITFSFPTNEEVGPSIVPRLWIFILIPLNLFLLFGLLKKTKIPDQEESNNATVLIFITILVLYLLGIHFLGYFISSFIFVFGAIYLLGYRRYVTMLIITSSWLLFSYLVFYRLLFVPLPVGKLIEFLL